MTLSLFPAEPARPRQVTLVRLAGEIARAAATIGAIAVEGEVHRPAVTGTGRIYFTLRDRAAQISVTCPPNRAKRCRAVAGERVCAVGSLNWVNERGQLQLVADEVVPVGDGAVAAMIAQARARLAADGLLDRPRRPIPLLPTRIGVVCGTDAAVRHDIESVVEARFADYPVTFAETFVSGPGAATAITEAMTALAAHPGVEVIILARGGGDATQLLPWSDEELCRAVSSCPVPVVSAIGHHADRPLCDEVADLRCGTPSLAASAVVPDRRGLEEELDKLLTAASAGLSGRLTTAARRLERVDTGRSLLAGVDRAAHRLQRSTDRLEHLHPSFRLAQCQARLESAAWRAPMQLRIVAAGERMEAHRRQLHALSPRRVLERGYAVVRTADGAVLRDASRTGVGQPLDVELAEGRLRVVVEGGNG